MDKERLRQYSAIKKEICSIRQQLEEVAAEMYAPKKIRLTGLPNQNGANNEQIERLILKQEKFIDEYFWSGNATEAAKKAEYKGAPFATGYRNLKNETIINELETKIKENLEFDLMFINGFLARYKNYLLPETNIKSKVRTRTKVLKNVSDLKKEINWLEEIQKG